MYAYNWYYLKNKSYAPEADYDCKENIKISGNFIQMPSNVLLIHREHRLNIQTRISHDWVSVFYYKVLLNILES